MPVNWSDCCNNLDCTVCQARQHTQSDTATEEIKGGRCGLQARAKLLSRACPAPACCQFRQAPELPGLERLFEFHWYSGTGEVVCGSFTGTGEVVSRGSYADFWWFLTLKSVSDPVKNQSSVSSVAQNY